MDQEERKGSGMTAQKSDVESTPGGDGQALPASDCSTRYCEVCREPFSELSKELQGELRELFEAVKTCAKCCQQKLKEAYERTMVD